MGIFDSFRKNKNEDKQQNNIPSNDIELKYSSGVKAEVNFGDVVDYDGKHLQEVNLIYITDGKFVGNKIYMDPHIGQDENGKNIYNTKEYFKELASSNYGLTKGFFEKNSVNAMETNYIGSIGKDSQGNYNRSIDHAFLRKYKGILEAEKEQKKIEAETKAKSEDDKFREGLKDKTFSAYDRSSNQNHVEVLNENMLKQNISGR